MKKNINFIFTLLSSVLFVSCIVTKSTKKRNFDRDEIIEMIIKNYAKKYKTPKVFLEERNNKEFDVFEVNIYEENTDHFVIGISPRNYKIGIEHEYDTISYKIIASYPSKSNFITIYPDDSIGKVPKGNLPNRYVIEKRKLFLWQDSITPLSREIVEAINSYGVLDSTVIKKHLGLLPKDYKELHLVEFDNRIVGDKYYFCKNKRKFKIVRSNKAYNTYEPPKLKCN
ncbi:hypothetical protein AB4865_06240 [Capnocytophaga sp. ARDL2]|uniref:hypothetical protein n=1 Tax=Capnocytophaga sp. ARDL2 TaxID=3238809 RepID=UPI0035562D41